MCGVGFCACLSPVIASGQPPSPARIVVVPSGALRLKASLWVPSGAGPFPAVLFNHGSGGNDPEHTAGLEITDAAASLAPAFVGRGYAFLYLYRRGQGLSADQAAFIQDRLTQEQRRHGPDARRHLQLTLMTTEQLDDVLAGIAFLKTVPQIDAARIALMGHSFGGQLTLLAAGREPGIRAVVTFGAAANSWRSSAELRRLLRTAVDNAHAPIMLIHASNDYDTAPGAALQAELARLQRPAVLKIYPPVGASSDEGHNLVYLAMSSWEPDVFSFLDQRLKN